MLTFKRFIQLQEKTVTQPYSPVPYRFYKDKGGGKIRDDEFSWMNFVKKNPTHSLKGDQGTGWDREVDGRRLSQAPRFNTGMLHTKKARIAAMKKAKAKIEKSGGFATIS